MMNPTDTQRHVFPLGKAALTLALVSAGAAGVVSLILLSMGQQPQINLNLLAALICGGAGLIGLLPVWLMSKHHRYGGAYGFLVGMVFRMVVAGAVVMAAMWGFKWSQARPLAMWVSGWYLLVLMVEVKLLSSYVLTLSIAPQPTTTCDGQVAMESES